MKKALFVAVFLVITSPFMVSAQTFNVEQQSSLDTLKQRIIDLLTQEIASLQAQIQQILNNQANQQIQSNTVIQLAPTFGSIAPSVPSPLTFSIATNDPAVTNSGVKVPLTAYCINPNIDLATEYPKIIDEINVDGLQKLESDQGTLTFKVEATPENRGGYIWIGSHGSDAGSSTIWNGTFSDHTGALGITKQINVQAAVTMPTKFKITILSYVSDSGRVINGLPLELPEVNATNCQ